MLAISQSGGLQTALEIKSRTTAPVLAKSIALKDKETTPMGTGVCRRRRLQSHDIDNADLFRSVAPIRSEPGSWRGLPVTSQNVRLYCSCATGKRCSTQVHTVLTEGQGFLPQPAWLPWDSSHICCTCAIKIWIQAWTQYVESEQIQYPAEEGAIPPWPWQVSWCCLKS